ncbi:hypothetical protein TNCV_3717891 [Trichonephila clavipes]|nr:hypothetical protein TNCV_3717891 [Trichonephila clavipes]
MFKLLNDVIYVVKYPNSHCLAFNSGNKKKSFLESDQKRGYGKISKPLFWFLNHISRRVRGCIAGKKTNTFGDTNVRSLDLGVT